jgi:hypothetical protein
MDTWLLEDEGVQPKDGHGRTAGVRALYVLNCYISVIECYGGIYNIIDTGCMKMKA